MAEITPADPNASARTRARRTLIGSAILALTAVVVVPLVIDSKPKPWGDDVKLRIPSKDSTFDTPLQAPAVPTAPAASAKPAAPTTSAPAPATPAAAPTPADSPSPPATVETPKPSPSPTPEAAKPAASTPAKSTPATSTAPAAKAGKVVLQAGAFTNDERIKTVEAELRKAGYTPYREEVPAKNGTVTRIRFKVANEDAAHKAISKLSANDIAAKIVTP
jgi:DedD protein